MEKKTIWITTDTKALTEDLLYKKLVNKLKRAVDTHPIESDKVQELIKQVQVAQKVHQEVLISKAM